MRLFGSTAEHLGLVDRRGVTFNVRLRCGEVLAIGGRSHVGVVPHLLVESYDLVKRYEWGVTI